MRFPALSLVSFLDQLCLWICEVRLELAIGVSWLTLKQSSNCAPSTICGSVGVS